jgi:hypothetical protein
MVFPFTFALNIPGIINPFTRHVNVNPIVSHDSDTSKRRALQNVTRPSRSPTPMPLSRKRGWEPSIPEPSYSTATLASTAGYLDTPKYRQNIPDEYQHITMSDSINLANLNNQEEEEEEGALHRVLKRGCCISLII